MPDAILRFHHRRFPADHSKDTTFGAHRGATLTADAVADINMGMLSAWTFGKQFTVGSGFSRAPVAIYMPPQIQCQRQEKRESINSEKEPIFRQHEPQRYSARFTASLPIAAPQCAPASR